VSGYRDGLLTGWTIGLQFSARAREFPRSVKAMCGLPNSLSVGYRGLFPRKKADHSHPSSAEVKNCEVIPPPPYTSLWHGV
jgi:hypothetical protein